MSHQEYLNGLRFLRETDHLSPGVRRDMREAEDLHCPLYAYCNVCGPYERFVGCRHYEGRGRRPYPHWRGGWP